MSAPLDNENFFSETRRHVEEYAKLRYDLIRAEVAEKSAKISASLFSVIILGGLLFFVILFISLVAGFWFSELLQSTSKGFGIIAGFYLLLFIVLAMFRKALLEMPVINKVISTIYTEEHD